MPMLLAGDVGGTKTILRLATFSPPIKLQMKAPPIDTCYEQTYVSKSFAGLAEMVEVFLAEAEAALGERPSPTVACFGIAGPVVDNRSELTNLNWSLEAEALARRLAIAQVSLINDFAANGYGILGLTDSDLHVLQDAPMLSQAPIAIIGAGTGLGEAFLIPQGGCYHVFPGEGGHADFAPQNSSTYQLCRYLQKTEQLSRISVERVVSGTGLISVYQCLRDEARLAPETPALAEAFERWEQALATGEEAPSPAAEIAKQAAAGDDILARRTMQLFIQLYGSEAGNFALKLLPYGGLYITGGIAAKILPMMEKEGFIDAFLDKGRMKPLLENIPVKVVLNPKVGLIGAVLYAAREGSVQMA
ncbi:MAG: glucokinase [Phormidesmis sp.]